MIFTRIVLIAFFLSGCTGDLVHDVTTDEASDYQYTNEELFIDED